MAKSIDAQIKDAVIAQLLTCTTANGYNTNIKAVYKAGEKLTTDKLYPSITLFINGSDKDQEYEQRNDFLSYTFEFWDGKTDEADGSYIDRYEDTNADITKCLMKDGIALDSLVQHIEMEPYYYDLNEAGSVVCIMEARIERTINASNPYQLG
jgi:hypothetical protein